MEFKPDFFSFAQRSLFSGILTSTMGYHKQSIKKAKVLVWEIRKLKVEGKKSQGR
jgi:hypothetical protein